jgi:DNA integrity scanning protein DisA with diadenylate cyclase activity
VIILTLFLLFLFSIAEMYVFNVFNVFNPQVAQNKESQKRSRYFFNTFFIARPPREQETGAD